jgi:stage III sporulation protein AE
MRRIFAILTTTILLLSCSPAAFAERTISSQQAGILDLPKIVDSFNKGEIISEFNPNQLIEDITKGNLNVSTTGIINKAFKFFMREINQNMMLLIRVIFICMLCAILRSLQDNFGGEVSNMAFYACYLLMISFIIVSFKDVLNIGQRAIVDMVSFMKVIIPILITLLASTGSPVSSSMLYPAIMMVVEFFSNMLGTVIIPVIFLIAVLSIIANVSEKVQLSQLAGCLKTASVWILGIMLTIFVGIISVQSSLAGTVDGVAVKTAKFAFSASIPFVGKILSDSVETVLGCSLVIKNSVGVIGMILVLSIVLSPLIKILAMITIYKFCAIIAQPIADSRIVKCLDDIGGTLALLFAVLVSVSIMFIIGITALVRAGNIAGMIR